MKKIIHVVSHTHWDREWYMPHEKHNMRLVDLIDDLIEAFKDPLFKYYQLDGHYLPIEDYLEVKPDKREVLTKLIRQGKLRIGPWYILQDAFLTSGESNIKNLQVGIKKTSKYGKSSMIGYFPDTFGNIGQAPQILKKAGIGVAYFGRGVKATGFDNLVVEDYTSKNSELIWQSPNGDTVLGILFANWYCNGVDIPEEEVALKKYMDKKIEDMEKYASTSHLLLMNGCDHSPVQKNIGKIIKKANEMYDDYEFIHSNLDYYFECVNNEVKDLGLVKGELRSQNTDGWWTLQSTSSSRYYLKKYNKTLERDLEEIINPLFTLFVDKAKYPYEKIDYLYEKLMQNHPHDSICGCSVDEVHDSNLRRFKDVRDGIDYLKDLARENIIATTRAEDDGVSLAIINTLPYERIKEVEMVVKLDKTYFRGDFEQVYQRLNKKVYENLSLFDKDGNEIACQMDFIGTRFSYDLPKNAFRKPYYANEFNLRFTLKLGGFEKKILTLKESKKAHNKKAGSFDFVENNFYKIEINDNSSLNIFDKRNKKTYKNVLAIEDGADIGNEYIYRGVDDEKRIFSGKLIDKHIQRLDGLYLIKLKEEFILPKQADEDLRDAQIRLIDISRRVAHRDVNITTMIIEKEIKVFDDKSSLEIKINLDNKAKDHRMRLLFGHDLDIDDLYAESIFECVKRRAYPPETWQNPDYSQNFNRYVQVKDKDDNGFSVSAIGLGEYENIKDQGLYLTLFRSVGELGDWGDFQTPDAQLVKDELSHMEFDLYFDSFSKDFEASRKRVLQDRVDFFPVQLEKGYENTYQAKNLDLDLGDNQFSTLFRNQEGQAILRVYNPSDKDKDFRLEDGVDVDILAKKEIAPEDKTKIRAFDIRTFKLEI
ncbi:MAG: glycoside hydrolase family 38 C-terminal domain-containing protein [Anaerococcus sp.]|uniref:alpha-mannosidase n=1 Tax=Anaerococcus sp. AGMB09787 TaxID=2922869 RepID=UPI001FAFADC7|nr:glycoside hydrolase family 38 C-terminal domain-containing protein [Anaerococcus sp. AGMB09787]MDD7044758.1 glycoside hydrolase family 38 C-terminal domain-containing protein [Peptoniphilaceae bacterium]MDY2919485.1 glycoside hydrolase family 38 C-terminal domain-containing protein [Anaerococcus sp.]